MKSQFTRFLAPATLLVAFSVAAQASNGTSLSVIASNADASPACSGNPVTIDITVTSTASEAPITAYVSTDGVTFTSIGSVGNWSSSSGRSATAEGTAQVAIPGSGTTDVEIRVTQPGFKGDPNKKASADVLITPQCGGSLGGAAS